MADINSARISRTGDGKVVYKNEIDTVATSNSPSMEAVVLTANTLINPDVNEYLRLSGGEMIGSLFLSGNPVSGREAATKTYVDTMFNNVPVVDTSAFVATSGGTMTGALTLFGAPTSGLHAATKNYVDAAISAVDYSGQLSMYVSKSGGTMTGALTLSGNPTSNLHAATKSYVDGQIVGLNISNYLAKSGGTLTGALVLAANPTANMHASTKEYVDTVAATIDIALGGYVAKTGSEMSGALTLSGDPTLGLHAATKTYVDNAIATIPTADLSAYVQKSGATMTGPIILSGAPTNNLHAASKLYVDTAVATVTPDLSSRVAKAGDSMTGALTLPGAPTNALHATTKAYVDNSDFTLTRADISSWNAPSFITRITVSGYAAHNDDGAATYRATGAETLSSLPGINSSSNFEGRKVVTGGRMYTFKNGGWDIGHSCYAQSADGRYWELDETQPSLSMMGAFGVKIHVRRTDHVWPSTGQDALPALMALSRYIVCRYGRGNIRVPNYQYWLSSGFVGDPGVGMIGDLTPTLPENNNDYANMGCTFFSSNLNPAIFLRDPPDVKNIAVVNVITPTITVKRWIAGITNNAGSLTVQTMGEHNFVAGVTSVVISGTAKYDGTYTVSTVTRSSFTVTYTGSNTGADNSGGTLIGSTPKGITTVSTTSNYEPVGYEEARQFDESFSGQGFRIAPADFARIENIRYYCFNIGCEVSEAKAVRINNSEGDGRSNGNILSKIGQGGSIDRIFVKPRTVFGAEKVPGMTITNISSHGNNRIKITLNVPIYYDYTAANDKLELVGVTASNGYAINADWRVTPIEIDPYSVVLDGSNFTAGAPYTIGSGTATVQPFSGKYRIGGIALADNGSGGVRVTTAWPHLITGMRRMTMVETIGSDQAKAWFSEKEFRTAVVDATHFDLLDLQGNPVAWDASLSSVTATCCYFFGGMREGVGLTWQQIDASRVYDSWSWGFTTGHVVDTGMVNFFACGRGEEGTYRGPSSIGWWFKPSANGIRIYGGETANAGLPILMEAAQDVTIIGNFIASGASGVTIRQTAGTLRIIGSPLEGLRGTNRSVVSLGGNMRFLEIHGKTDLTAVIADSGSENLLRRVSLFDGLQSSAPGRTLNSPIVIRPIEEDFPSVISLRSGDVDDVDSINNIIISGDRMINPNTGLTVGATGAATTSTPIQIRRQGVLRDGDSIGRLEFYGRNAGTRIRTIARASNVVTLTSRWPHGLIVGDNVTLADAGSFDGVFTITSVPDASTVVFSQTGSDEVPSVVTGVISRGVIKGTPFGQISSIINDITYGGEDGSLVFSVARDGSLTSTMTVSSTQISANVPFTLKSYTNTQRNALTTVVDGMLIYNSTLGAVQARVAGAWVSL